jgi:hypothetical protein
MPHGTKQHVWSACYRQRVPHISPPQLLISDRKDVLRISAYGSHDRPLWLLRRIQCIMASNDEVVALSVCTILMVGSILKYAAAQIGPLGANPLQESAWRRRNKTGTRNKWYDMHRWLLLRPACRIKLQTSTGHSIGCTYQGFRPAFKP